MVIFISLQYIHVTKRSPVDMVVGTKTRILILITITVLVIILYLSVIQTQRKYETRNMRKVDRSNINTNSQIATKHSAINANDMHAHIDDIIPMEDGFEPDVTVDFPTIAGATVGKIPHIMHQMWMVGNGRVKTKTSNFIAIPQQYEKTVKSFFEHHRQWTYSFWDAWSAREFVRKEYPDVLPVYDNYDEVIFRSDSFRYMLLYKYGGVYADLDTTFLRPLDRVTVKYPCVLNSVPFEHPIFQPNQQPYRINNNLILCAPGHPFLKVLIDNLASASMLANVLDRTGPAFVTSSFVRYNNIYGKELFHAYKAQYRDGVSPYYYRGTLPPNDDGYLYLTNTQYFSLPMMTADVLRSECSKSSTRTLTQRMCSYLNKRNFNLKTNKYTFTIHAWSVSYGHTDKFRRIINFKGVKNGNIVKLGMQ